MSFNYFVAGRKKNPEAAPSCKKQRAATSGYGPFRDRNAQRDYFAFFLS